MNTELFGLPVEIHEAVDLELGDLVPDGASDTLLVIAVDGTRARVRSAWHTGDAELWREWWLPRRVDLHDEAPGYVLRPSRPARAFSTVLAGEPFLERLRAVARGDGVEERGILGNVQTILRWRSR